jgi:hypothetical protein
MRLDFGQVEIGPAAGAEGVARIVEKVEPEVEQRCRDRLAVHREVLLDKVPAARANDQDCGFCAQSVALAAEGIAELEPPFPAIHEVRLALDVIGEGRRVGVLEISHENVSAGIERVYNHLAVDRTGYLDPAVNEVGRDRRNSPFLVADMPGLRQDIRKHSGVILLLRQNPVGQQSLPPRLKSTVKLGEES